MACEDILHGRAVTVTALHDYFSKFRTSEVFLAFFFYFGNRVISWTKPGHGLPFFVNNKLGEVPFDGVHQEALLFGFQKCPQGMSVIAVDVDLAEHVELDVVLASGELLDLLVCAGLLEPELVAREPQNT